MKTVLAQAFERQDVPPPEPDGRGRCGDSRAARSSASLLSQEIAFSIVDQIPGQTGKEAPGMNRRTAVMLTMLLGVLLPPALWAQATGSRRTSGSQSSQGKTLRPTAAKDPAEAVDQDEPAASVDEPPGRTAP